MNRFNPRDEEVTMRHHEDALAAYVRTAREDPDAIGVVVVGSVARGTERADSDVDVYLVVSDERWARAVSEGRVMFVDRRGVDYPDGYVDVKLVARGVLVDAPLHADEPFRASFEGARIAWTRDDDLGELVAATRRVPDEHWASELVAQLAQLRLHAGYFLPGAERDGDPLLARSSAAHALLAAHRALLARHRRLHRGPKYLVAAVAELPERPTEWDDIVSALLDAPTGADGRRLIAALDDHLSEDGRPPIDDAAALSRFVLDNEYAWSTRIPVPEYS